MINFVTQKDIDSINGLIHNQFSEEVEKRGIKEATKMLSENIKKALDEVLKYGPLSVQEEEEEMLEKTIDYLLDNGFKIISRGVTEEGKYKVIFEK